MRHSVTASEHTPTIISDYLRQTNFFFSLAGNQQGSYHRRRRLDKDVPIGRFVLKDEVAVAPYTPTCINIQAPPSPSNYNPDIPGPSIMAVRLGVVSRRTLTCCAVFSTLFLILCLQRWVLSAISTPSPRFTDARLSAPPYSDDIPPFINVHLLSTDGYE